MFPIELVKFSKDIPTHLLKLLELVVIYCNKGQWEDASTLSQILLKESEKGLESDSLDVGLILSIVGFINKEIGKYDDTESLWKRAILIFEENDQDMRFTHEIIQGLIFLFAKNKRWMEAEPLVKKAITIWEKLDVIDAIELADLKKLMGMICLEQKKPDEAKGFLRAVLPVYIEKYEIMSVEVEKIFTLLEAAYFWKNNIAESKKSFKNANEIADTIPLCSLGELCEERPILVYKAINYYERALKIYEKTAKDSADYLQMTDIELKLSKCFLKMYSHDQSEEYLRKCLLFYMERLANDDPVMLDVNIHLALCYVRSEKFDRAKKLYEKILDNVYTDESGVSIVKLAKDNEEKVENKFPILSGKSNIIDFALKNLTSLYILDGKYKAAETLQDFRESKRDLMKDDGI